MAIKTLAPGKAVPVMPDGSERFGKQDTYPFLDVRERANDPLVTFREWVERGELPPGYQRMLALKPQADGSLVIEGQHGYLGELATVDLARLMKGSKLTWRFEMAPKVGH